jgi:NADH dehydrogenase [ubiquinone] 1 alpha subcomplex assembly factor 5
MFPAALAALPEADGRVAVTLRLAVMTGWAPGADRKVSRP